MVGDRVECRWIIFREGGVCVLAVETFLEAIDHCFPVEATFIRDAAAMRELGEIDGVGEFLEARKVFVEARGVHREGSEDETAWCNMASDRAIFLFCKYDNTISIDVFRFWTTILDDDLDLRDLIHNWFVSLLEASHGSKKMP